MEPKVIHVGLERIKEIALNDLELFKDVSLFTLDDIQILCAAIAVIENSDRS